MGGMRIKNGSWTNEQRLPKFSKKRHVASKRSNHGFKPINDVQPMGIRATHNCDLGAIADDVTEAFCSKVARFDRANHDGCHGEAGHDVAGLTAIEHANVERAFAEH